MKPAPADGEDKASDKAAGPGKLQRGTARPGVPLLELCGLAPSKLAPNLCLLHYRASTDSAECQSRRKWIPSRLRSVVTRTSWPRGRRSTAQSSPIPVGARVAA